MFIRVRVTPLVCLAVGLACAAGAQANATGSIAAHATVDAVLTLSNPTPLDFGTLLAGQTSTEVPPAFGAGPAHAGSIQVDFTDPITLNVTIDPGNELTGAGKTLT